MEEEFTHFIQQVLQTETDVKKRQLFIDNLENQDFRLKFYSKTKDNLEVIRNNEKVKHVFRLLFPYFLQLSFRKIILLIWDCIDWQSVPFDQLQKLIRLFIDNYKINDVGYRHSILQLIKLKNEIEEYAVQRICNNTIDIDFLKEVLNETKSQHSRHFVEKTMRAIKVLNQIQPGLEYYFLIFHGDFTKTVDFIQRELKVSISDQMFEANEQDGELFESKIYHDKTGQFGKVNFGRKEGDSVETLMLFRCAQVSFHSTTLSNAFIISCSPTINAIITSSNIKSVEEAKVGKTTQNIIIQLHHPPLLSRSNRCGCEIRAISNVLWRCNCILINFQHKNNNKLFNPYKKGPVLTLHYRSYLPSYGAKSSIVQHLYDYNKLEHVSEESVGRLELFVDSNNAFNLTLFTRTVLFCHIPLCSQLLELMNIFSKKVNVNQIIPCTPLNIQKEVQGILPWIVNFNVNSPVRQYREISVKTPTKILHLGFHGLPFIPKESAEIFYFRDEGMGMIDHAVLQRFDEDHPFPENIIYSFDDLLHGRFWVPTELNGNVTIPKTFYPIHLPLYLNSYSLQNLISLGLTQNGIESIVMDLRSKLETSSTSRQTALQFLPINEEFTSRIFDIINNFYNDNINFTQSDQPIISYVMKLLETRLRRGLLPIIEGGTFTFKIDENNILHSGQISLHLKSFCRSEPSKLLIMSPFLEKHMVRQFDNNPLANRDWEPNVVYFSKEDADYFKVLNRFQRKCNCIWDDIILKEVGNCKFTLPLDEDISVFEGNNYHTFIKQYIRLCSERVNAQRTRSLMNDILNPYSDSTVTYNFMPPRSFDVVFREPKKIKKNQKVNMNGWCRNLFFLLDGISNYRRNFSFDQVTSSWTLQITGNIDDPFIGFQISEFFEIMDNFSVPSGIKNGNNAMFYGLIYLLTQEKSVADFVQNYVELSHLEEID